MASHLLRDVLRYALLNINVWQFSPFALFPIWTESQSAVLKVTYCHSIFRNSLFWFPEMLPTCTMRGRWLFPLSLLGLLALVTSALFLIFFSCPFLSNGLNHPFDRAYVPERIRASW